MEMGEMTAVGLSDDIMKGCPFEHEEKETKKIENDLKGVGTTLGARMAQGKATSFDQTGVPESLPPKDDPKHSLYGNNKPISLPKHSPESFPLTCAAHHLIPAQASLRDSKLVQWLVHGSISSQVKNGGSGTGRLRQNVGYDVNGSQNGVWLPGPYALNTDVVRIEMGLSLAPQPGKKRRTGPVEVLEEKNIEAVQIAPGEPPEMELEPEDMPSGSEKIPAPSGAYNQMEGRSGVARTATLKKAPTKCEGPFPELYHYYFLYTVSAMQKVGAQYHDAHTDYSERVLQALNEINVKVSMFSIGVNCDKCKEKNKQRSPSSEDFPPPTGLITVLDILSTKLRTLLKGPPSGWKWPLYTSKMSLHYWRYEQDPVLRLP
jgi:hypothetical protein